MSINLVMPSLGESVIEGTVTKWLVHEGDMVAREQPLVSVATDKADTDVPAPQAGRIVKILAPEGATVKIGDHSARSTQQPRPLRPQARLRWPQPQPLPLPRLRLRLTVR